MQLQIRLNGISEDGKAQFLVMNEGKQSPLVALASPWDIPADAQGMTFRDDLHWYLEEYLKLPHGPFITRAEKVLASLSKWGRECFAALFDSGGPAQNWYNDARKEGLENLRITIACDNATVLSWPWEALESRHDGILAQHCQIARQLDDVGDILPLSDKLPMDRLNILYIIARPYGDKDVGFQTLARPLIEFVNEGNWPVHIDVLRPPTFERLQAALEEKPYHIVHFDGHGGFGENSLPGENPGLAFANASEHGEMDDNIHNDGIRDFPTADTFAVPFGALVFEREDSEQGGKRISGADLGSILKKHNIPSVILNACQSAMMGDGDEDKVFASVAASLLKSGVRSVVAMSYSLWVSGAKVFVPVFYKELFKSGNIAAAMQAGRHSMFLNRERDTVIGQVVFYDWMVPVIYQQRDDFLPKIAPSDSPSRLELLFPDEARRLGEYGFIGRDRSIRDLERAIRRKPASILIHGMMGEGKTTLAKGFLNWLKDTNGLGEGALWLDFRNIRSAEYIVNAIADVVAPQFGTMSAGRLEDKFAAVSQTLKTHRYFIVWDNFESASGIPGTEVSPLLPENDRAMLKRLLQDLRGGSSKVLITSRSPEGWLALQECFPLPLGGMQGEEVWEYCNAVVNDLGLKIKRGDKDYAKLIKRLGGNPLAIRAILLCLHKNKNRSAAQLRAELDKEFKSFAGDESAQRIQSVFNLLNKGLDEKLAPVFQLIGLHEHYVNADYLGYMLQDTEYQESGEYLTECFTILVNAGFCQEVGKCIYKMHPTLRNCLMQAYPAAETLQREFVDLMGRLADELAPKKLHEKRMSFMLNEANFHRAMDMAVPLEMEAHYRALVKSIATFKLNIRDFSQAELWYKKYGDICLKQGDSEAFTYYQLGKIAEAQRDFPSAQEWHKKSLDISLRQGNEHYVAGNYRQLGSIADEQRDFPLAQEWCKKSLEIYLKQGDERGMADIYRQLGRIAWGQRDFPAAEEWNKKSLDIDLKHGDEHSTAITCNALSIIAYEQRDFLSAEEWCKKSLKIYLKYEDEYENNTATIYHQLGIIAGEQRDFPSAQEWYMKSLEINLKQGNEHNASMTYHRLGIDAEEQRDFPSAQEWYMKSLEIKLKLGDEHGAASTYHGLGNIYYNVGNNEISGQFYLEAIEGFMHSNDKFNSFGSITNFTLLLNSSDSPTKEKLRRLWEAKGFPMEVLDKMEEPTDDQPGTSDPNPGTA